MRTYCVLWSQGPYLIFVCLPAFSENSSYIFHHCKICFRAMILLQTFKARKHFTCTKHLLVILIPSLILGVQWWLWLNIPCCCELLWFLYLTLCKVFVDVCEWPFISLTIEATLLGGSNCFQDMWSWGKVTQYLHYRGCCEFCRMGPILATYSHSLS